MRPTGEWKWKRVRVGSYRYVLMVDGVQQGPVNAWTIRLGSAVGWQGWVVRDERGRAVGAADTLDEAKDIADTLRQRDHRRAEQERKVRQRSAEIEKALRDWERWREEHPARSYVDVETGEYL